MAHDRPTRGFVKMKENNNTNTDINSKTNGPPHINDCKQFVGPNTSSRSKRPWMGILFCVIMFTSSFMGTIFMLAPFLPLLLVKPRWYRIISDEVLSSWTIFIVALLEEVVGVKPVCTGDMIDVNEPCLIMMNHPTRLDWLFFWLCLVRRGSVLREKIILKSDLKGIPGAGWAMQQACYIFVERKWQADRMLLTRILDYFKDINYTPQVLIFPEGTNFDSFTKAKSDEYAREHGLAPYNHVLHPRTTGFTFLAQHMRQGGLLHSVYDVSVGYPVSLTRSELGIVQGRFPPEIHFNVRRYPSHSLPADDAGLTVWCQERWREKEERLQQFYTDKSFPGGTVVAEKVGGCCLRVMVVVWAALHLMWAVMLLTSPLARWYVVICVVLYSVAYYKYGGLEQVEIMCHRAKRE